MTSIAAADTPTQTPHDQALHAAALQFAEHGFTGTTLNDIIQAAPTAAAREELSRYTSKSVLAADVASAAYVGFPFVTFNDNGVHTSGLSRIALCCHTVAHRFQTEPLAMATLMLKRETVLIDAPMPEPVTTWLTLIEEMLDEAVEEREISADTDTRTTAWMLVAPFFGMTEIGARQNIGTEIHNRIDLFLAANFTYIGAKNIPEILAAARKEAGH